MKIRITEVEIAQILLAAVTSNVQFKVGAEPKYTFTATRGDDGIVFEVDVPYMGVGALDFGTSAGGNTQADPASVVAVEPGAALASPQASTETAAVQRRTRGPNKPKALFGNLTSPAATAQDSPVEQTTDGQEAAADDEAPFVTTEDATTGSSEAATNQGTEGDAEQAETPPPPKGKSLFDT